MKTVSLESLSKSKFRAKFRLDDEDKKYIDQSGLETLRRHANDFVKKRLAPANPKNDGKQTPYQGHPVFKAQHATATCCRSCLKKWYGIEKDKAMTTKEIDSVIAIIMKWIESKYKK